MAILDLTNQLAEKNDIQPKINRLNQLLQQRKPFWDRATSSQKKKWIVSDKDPIMSLAWLIYKTLRNDFFGTNYDKKE